jgi:hypothetical protein
MIGVAGARGPGALTGPLLDLWPKPEQWALRAQVHDGSRHVGIALLIEAHAVGLRQAQDLCHGPGVDEVLGSDERAHGDQSIAVDTVELSD